jgi:hypothetical protein
MKRLFQPITKVHLILSALVFMGFILVVLPAQALALANATMSSGSPDTSLFYTPSVFYTWAFEYGPIGRAHYIQSRFGFDVVWPLSYGALFYSGIRVGGLARRQVFARFALITVFFDYMENLFASIAMTLYPMEVSILVYIASFSTLFKWFSLLVSAVLMILGWFIWFLRRNKGRVDAVR